MKKKNPLTKIFGGIALLVLSVEFLAALGFNWPFAVEFVAVRVSMVSLVMLFAYIAYSKMKESINIPYKIIAVVAGFIMYICLFMCKENLFGYIACQIWSDEPFKIFVLSIDELVFWAKLYAMEFSIMVLCNLIISGIETVKMSIATKNRSL